MWQWQRNQTFNDHDPIQHAFRYSIDEKLTVSRPRRQRRLDRQRRIPTLTVLRLVRGFACQAAIAASVNHTVSLTRRPSPAS
jgi:hypothetical protein